MKRDFNMEKVIDQMRELRTKRNIQILSEELEDVNLDVDYQKELPNNSVKNVKYLGQIKWNSQEEGKDAEEYKDIYLVLEEKDGHVVQKYYTEDLDLLAVKDEIYGLILEEKDLDKAWLIKEIKELDENGILDLNQLEEERKEEIAKSLGVKVEDLSQIDEIDLDQEIEEDKEQGKDEEEENLRLDENEAKGLNIKEETSLGQDIKGTTLGNKLRLKEHGITDGVKLARATASSVNRNLDKPISNVDAFVVIRANGKAQVLGEDILKPDSRSGTNPTNDDLTINNDGTIAREVNTSSYEIVGSGGKEFLKIGNDESSGKEIKYSMWSNERGEYVSAELKTQRTMPQDSDVRQFMKDRGAGEKEATNIIDRDSEHGECKEKKVEDIDNDKNNDSHEHKEMQSNRNEIEPDDYIPNTTTTWRQFANACGYRGEGSIERAIQKFNEAKSENSDKTNEEVIKKTVEDIEEEFDSTIRR